MLKQMLLQLPQIFVREFFCKFISVECTFMQAQIFSEVSSVFPNKHLQYKRPNTVRMPENEYNLLSQKCSRCKGFIRNILYPRCLARMALADYRSMITSGRGSYQRKITINPEKRERMECRLSPSIMACRDHANADFLGRLASWRFPFQDRWISLGLACYYGQSQPRVSYFRFCTHIFARGLSSNLSSNRDISRQRMFVGVELSFWTRVCGNTCVPYYCCIYIEKHNYIQIKLFKLSRLFTSLSSPYKIIALS